MYGPDHAGLSAHLEELFTAAVRELRGTPVERLHDRILGWARPVGTPGGSAGGWADGWARAERRR
jgi:hypothetical protein